MFDSINYLIDIIQLFSVKILFDFHYRYLNQGHLNHEFHSNCFIIFYTVLISKSNPKYFSHSLLIPLNLLPFIFV